MSDDDATCYCGTLMRDHTAWGSCTSPRAMPEPEQEFRLERIVHQTYTCNGAVDKCERERFGMCQWHEEREAKE